MPAAPDFEDEVSVAKTIIAHRPLSPRDPRPLRNMADVDEEEAANSSSAAVVGKTSAYHCTCAGRGLHVATVRALNTFSIQACDAEQQQRTSGGDTFFVSIRGNSKVRARVRERRGEQRLRIVPTSSRGVQVLQRGRRAALRE